MNEASKRVVLTAAAASLSVGLMAGCETLSLADLRYADAADLNTRPMVVAELREAQRLRLLTVGEEDVPLLTEAHLRSLSQAVEEATVGEVIEAN